MDKLLRVISTGTLATALAMVVLEPTASATPNRTPATDEVLVAVQRDLGLTAVEAETLRARQTTARRLDADLRTSLGTTFGGAWFDAAAGTLVVNVTDPSRVPEVTAAGARAVVVTHSEADLNAIKNSLDTMTGKTAGTARERGGGSPLAGLVGWHVDPKTNSVVLTAIRGQRATVLDSLAKYGDAVRVEYTNHAARPAVNFVEGGDEINFHTCSAGFNLRNRLSGQGYLLTAGHCVSAGRSVYGQGGVFFGTVLKSRFPAFDDAIVSAGNTAYWSQGPWVDVQPSNGNYLTVSDFSNSSVGTLVCKSGITTKWTCGYITAKDETVQYSGVLSPVYGLTRHSACVEQGDSGGANVAGLRAWTPEA